MSMDRLSLKLKAVHWEWLTQHMPNRLVPAKGLSSCIKPSSSLQRHASLGYGRIVNRSKALCSIRSTPQNIGYSKSICIPFRAFE